MEIKKIYIFALAAHGQGISGGDRIFIEFARRWSKYTEVNIWVCHEGYQLCQRQKLSAKNLNYFVSNFRSLRNLGFFINYLSRILKGIWIGLTINLDNPSETIVYSASEFWMDSLPAWVLKLRFSKIKWVAAWYQTAPKPWLGFSEGRRENKYKFKAFFYWLAQLPIKPLIANFADYVLVNNIIEKKQFNRLDTKKRAIVVLGAVDLQAIENFKLTHKKVEKKYDAVFQGRFHPQKGVLELIDIWKLVVNKEKNAKLIMVGDGPLMKDIQSKIKYLGLSQNIILTGYLFDGPEKYTIFSQSKLVLHPSFYDSGGMAAAEGMAFGIPCIGFDLNSYKSYYPQGMIKATIGNLEEFANIITSLLNDHVSRGRIGAEGMQMIKKNWSWDKRAEEIFNEINR